MGDKCIYSVKKENAKMALDDEMADLKLKIAFPPHSLCLMFIFKRFLLIYSFLQQWLLCAYSVAGTVPGTSSRIKSKNINESVLQYFI